VESAGVGAATGGSGQGGRSGCLPRFKMGGALEQAGVLGDCACVGEGGAEADGAGSNRENPFCAFREIGAFRTRASTTPLRQLDLRPESKLRTSTPMIYDSDFAFSSHRQHTPHRLLRHRVWHVKFQLSRLGAPTPQSPSMRRPVHVKSE
jgi:hypothetical protein